MIKCTTNLIPENIAPRGASRILVYDSSGKLDGMIPLGRLARSSAESDYGVCVLADIHIDKDKATEKTHRALAYAEENCAFTCIAGDLTNQGIEGDYVPYTNVVSQYKKPIFAIAGNHENYSGRDPQWLFEATGRKPLYYSFGVNRMGEVVDEDMDKTPKKYREPVRDVYVMVGHYGGYDDSIASWRVNDFVSPEELQWFYETLEANRDKRCFVFIHVLPLAHGVGDPNGLYAKRSPKVAGIWDVEEGIGKAVVALLCHYKNTLLFHGHSHTKFELQRLDPKANYSNANGYRHLNVPSLAVPRDESGDALKDFPDDSEWYIMDVYDDYVILDGRYFASGDEDGHWSALGTYKIDTPLQTVEAGTFVDDTGLIQV